MFGAVLSVVVKLLNFRPTVIFTFLKIAELGNVFYTAG